jgi:putative glycosyl hydrolase
MARRIFLCRLLFISIMGILLFYGLDQYGNHATVYATRGTEFGMQIDTHYANKIPNITQLQQLKPAWIRGDYNKITFGPNWPASVKAIVLVNNETTNGQNPGQNEPFAMWKTYVDTIYVPKLQSILHESPSIAAIEVWNEEDFCRPGFCPYVPPQEYAYMLDQAATTIKAISPQTQVIMGGMAAGQIKYLQDVMQADLTGFSKIDAIGLHPYGASPDGWCVSGCGGNTLTTGDLATKVTDYWTTAGKPVWVTEIGIGSSDQAWQAEYLMRCFAVLQRLQVPVVIWYAWIDTMNPDFGLMDGQGNMKLSGYAFRGFNHRSIPFANLEVRT